MCEDIKSDIIRFGEIAGSRGLTPGMSGNISARCNDKIVITASGSANSFLSREDLCVIDFNGNIIEGSRKPSSEKFLHMEFYKKRKDINAICHFHSPCIEAFAISGSDELNINCHPEIIFYFGDIPSAEYALPGSNQLVENTAKYFDGHDVIIMKNHGVISGGKDIKDAFLKLELCESFAKSIVLSKFLGGAKILTENQINEINLLKKK